MASITRPRGLVAAALWLSAASLLAGCFLREDGVGDRCADAMKSAFPGGSIRVRDVGVDNDPSLGVSGMRATVEGVRRDVPDGGALAREVAVECGFANNILMRFRWTKGPLEPPQAAAPAPTAPAPKH